MQKSEEPLVVHRSLTWWLIDVCGSSAILLAVHRARTTIEPLQRVSDKYRPTGSDQQEDLATLGSVKLRQTELWPRDCLEKGHYSRRMVIYCGHSNAPTEYALKEESMHCSNRQVYSVGVAIHHAKFTRNARFYLAYIRLERSHR